MSKLYFTQIPPLERLESTSLYGSKLDHTTLYSHVLLRKAMTELDINLERFFSRYNLSSGRFTLMHILSATPGKLMPSELAQIVGVTQATISGLINSLEKSGFIARSSHESDGRAYVISLTELGSKVFHEIVPLYFDRIHEYWSSLTSPEKTQFNTQMEKIIDRLGHLGR